MKLYGIKNCDSVKKAKAWLDEQQIAYDFIDFKLTPPSQTQLETWCSQVDWQQLLNTQSKTYRELDASLKPVTTEIQAVQLMVNYPLLIKRPLIETENHCLVGFKLPAYQQFFLHAPAKDSAS
jgi:arsenate reductase